MKGRISRFGWLLITVVSLFVAPLRAQNFPDYQGHINDFKGVLSPEEANRLENRLRLFRDSTSVELAVVIMDLPDGEEHMDYTNRLARTWGVGGQEADNGALLAIYPNVRKARIEVGYGLEATLTDARCTIILDDQVKPRLKEGNYDAAVAAAVEEMIIASAIDYPGSGTFVPAPADPDGDWSMVAGVGGALLAILGLPIFLIWLARRNSRRSKNRRYGNYRAWENRNNPDYVDPGTTYISGSDWSSSSNDSSWSSGGDSGSSWSSGSSDSGSSSDFGGFSGGDFGGGGASSDW